ncbi:MAG: hypothetical protein P8J20_08745 [Novosphingobium sp.]|nr:hypothetical protein [Novosphingobium sp.]
MIFFDFSIHSYRITFPNLKTIMVDSGLSAVAAKKAGFDHYDPAAQARVSKELKNTQMVVFLSDNDLHIGGLRPSGLEQPTQDSFKKMDCPEPRAIVPGIVEIPICDNVIASRMVYVRLDDRREFLLAGDIAPTKESARYQAGPSRYMNRFIHDPGRVAIHSWLKTIKCLTKQAPQMIVIPGHAPLSTEDMPPSFQKRRTP